MEFDYTQPYASGRSPVMGRNVVATSQPLAAQAGLQMLARGGNAIDAALAAAIAMPVVEPTGNGLGSDAFAILHDGAELHGLNASGRAPAGWSAARFAGHAAMPERGWDSVTTPGAVSAWVALSERFGALPFETLFEPAIQYAEDGFAVSPIIAGQWAHAAGELRAQPGFAQTFMPGGRAPRAGELFRAPNMARALKAIAQSRGRAFYEGEIAEAIAAFAQAHGGALTVEDMAAHRADWVGTIQQPFGEVALHEIPPNGQGIAALIALGILSHTEIGEAGPDSVAGLHLQIEAMKLALADTYAHVGDADAMLVSSEQLLAPDYLRARAGLIERDRAGDPQHGLPGPSGTIYITAADAQGRMVSYIQSNYAGFGSGVVEPEYGISLQNRGAGFSLDPASPNAVAPRKRPFHTIIPGFVTRAGAPLTSFGVMGGPIQAQGHVQMMLRMMTFGQNPQAASDAPRWRVEHGRHVLLEPGFDPELRAGLHALGHDVGSQSPDRAFSFGGAQLIYLMENGMYVAGSDHRKDGHAVAY